MYGYASWIKKNISYMTFFTDNVKSERVPLKMKNICWIGGKNVLNTGTTHLVDFKEQKPSNCKYGLYLIPGTEGDTISERMQKHYKKIADDNLKKSKEAELEANKAKAMISLINNPKNTDVATLFHNAKDVSSKIERDAATKDVKSSIDNNLTDLQKQEQSEYSITKIFGKIGKLLIAEDKAKPQTVRKLPSQWAATEKLTLHSLKK